jgi:hypothetical protein
MEWVGLIGELLGCALECAVWATLESGAGSSATPRGERHMPSGETPPLDGEAFARYVSRSSTHEVRGGGSFLTSPVSRDPLWDRELDG